MPLARFNRARLLGLTVAARGHVPQSGSKVASTIFKFVLQSKTNKFDASKLMLKSVAAKLGVAAGVDSRGRPRGWAKSPALQLLEKLDTTLDTDRSRRSDHAGTTRISNDEVAVADLAAVSVFLGIVPLESQPSALRLTVSDLNEPGDQRPANA